MKRTLFIALVAALAAFTGFSALSVYADDDIETPNQARAHQFVDEDGDGVCDNHVAGEYGRKGLGNGANFVDEDGDGICDFAGTGRGQRLRDGSGNPDCNGNCDGAAKVRKGARKGGGRGGRGGRGRK
ncbi:MAG: hypothetical protein J7M24_02625 [Candidatus Latescibacteria bacterium]|nr:hypothetical protein [Candidatus Latescibacterota bacterium]